MFTSSGRSLTLAVPCKISSLRNMPENEDNSVPVQIPRRVRDEIEEELARVEPPRPTEGGLLAAAWEAYRRPLGQDVLDRLEPHHRALVAEFIRLLENPGDRKHKAFRDVVIGVLADRLEAHREES